MNPVRAPALIYGTAWKEDATERLVTQALAAGFRGIDTANQRKHYHEAGVGAALRSAFAGGLRRDEIFLQTKFTSLGGQDHRLPYDPTASIAKQVDQSFASSLDHLGVEQIDSYLLHGPSIHVGLARADWEAWHAMEDLARGGRAKAIGISNVSAAQLEVLHRDAAVKPAVVQNRTFTRPHADAAVRTFCAAHGFAYEGFSLLTAVPQALRHPQMVALAQQAGMTPAQAILRKCMDEGIVVLTGTTDATHMRQDLALTDMPLRPETATFLDALFA